MSFLIKEAYKQSEFGLIPSDWYVSSFEEVTVEHKQGYYTKEAYADNGVRLLRITDLKNPKVLYENSPFLIVSDKEYDQFKVEPGDFLFARSGAIGRYGIVPSEIPPSIFASYLIRFKFDTTKVVREFLGLFYESDYGQNQISKITQGSSNININANNIKTLKLPLPSLREQQKIAAILSAADEQIEKTEQLIEKTSELKKALMQQLFTTGIGHSEFKDTIMGKTPESWKLTILEDISKFITKGSTPTTYGFDWQDQGIFFFKSDVVKNGKFVYGDFKYIDENAHQHMLRSQIQAGDILMTITGNIGRVALVPTEIKRANINQHVARISVENPELNPLFVFYWLSQSKFIEYYNSIKTGLAYPQISLKQVRETIVPIPSMEEQKKIAEILNSVDGQIDTYEKEKEKQIELKKALMQQLLTGKLRVTV